MTSHQSQGRTETEEADLQVWLRWGRIGTGRSYQEEVARAHKIDADRRASLSKTGEGA